MFGIPPEVLMGRREWNLFIPPNLGTVWLSSWTRMAGYDSPMTNARGNLGLTASVEGKSLALLELT